MSDVFDPAKRSAVMRRVRSADTGPERAVRAILTRMGRGYTLQGRGLPGTPDIVMKGPRVAIFVNGCFWHGHDCARGSRKPRANAEYWSRKVARNRQRDAAARTELSALGWTVLTIWECELRDGAALETRLRGALPPRRKWPARPRPPS